MKLQKLVDSVLELQNLDLPVLIYKDAAWYYEDSELYINTDNNQEDLENGDGETYSWFCRHSGTKSDDGYIIFTGADNGCGVTDIVIIKLEGK